MKKLGTIKTAKLKVARAAGNEAHAMTQTLHIEDLQTWNTSVAKALLETDKVERLQQVMSAVKNTVGICFSGAFVFQRNAAPIAVFDEVEGKVEKNEYAEFAYLLDPIHDLFLEGNLPKVCLMRDNAPDEFFSSEYFNKYYRQLGIQDEYYLNFVMDENTTFHLTFTRIDNPNPFTKADLLLLEALRPTLRFAVDDYWAGYATPIREETAERQKIHDAVSQAFNTFGADVLTPREQEILQVMLKGFSDKATARILDISPGTVRNHKKNIFSKLEVTSQGQVFGLFLDSLANP